MDSEHTCKPSVVEVLHKWTVWCAGLKVVHLTLVHNEIVYNETVYYTLGHTICEIVEWSIVRAAQVAKPVNCAQSPSGRPSCQWTLDTTYSLWASHLLAINVLWSQTEMLMLTLYKLWF